MRTVICLSAALFLAGSTTEPPDEGPWTFNQFPFEKLKKTHGVALDQAWLEHVRLSSLRLNRVCSGAFVSPQGLVQTAHHCVDSCIGKLSTPEQDIRTNGFYAAQITDEVKCPGTRANQLLAITDISKRL